MQLEFLMYGSIAETDNAWGIGKYDSRQVEDACSFQLLDEINWYIVPTAGNSKPQEELVARMADVL